MLEGMYALGKHNGRHQPAADFWKDQFNQLLASEREDFIRQFQEQNRPHTEAMLSSYLAGFRAGFQINLYGDDCETEEFDLMDGGKAIRFPDGSLDLDVSFIHSCDIPGFLAWLSKSEKP
jgi:hypothetical protein